MDVSLHVLAWNGERDLPDLLHSLRALDYPQLAVRILDNGSIDDSRKILQEHASDWLIGCNAKNVGFAAGHNQLISYALHRWKGDDLHNKIVILVNQDMVLDARCVAEIVDIFERHAHVGVVQPKIYRALREEREEGRGAFSELLDTTGLVLPSGWRMEDRGAGMVDSGQFDDRISLAGASGAFVAYRMSALQDIAIFGEYFDEDFFAYREDCDLSLRFLRRKHAIFFAPLAKAWHYRSMYGAQQRTLFERLRDRRGHQSFRNALSTRNQLFFLVKSFSLLSWSSVPRIFFQEGGRILYGFFFEPETRSLLLSSLSLFPKMLRKRKEILRNTLISRDDLRAYVEN